MANQPDILDLANLFQTVTGTLSKNRENLNDADTYNHDHGDNMVDTFEVITLAMKEKKGADPADQLAYASEILRQRKSGSAQKYADGLSQASSQFQGQQVTSGNAMMLIQTLLGGGQAPEPQQQQGGIGDMLGSLLGGAGTKQTPAGGQQSSGDLDIGDLLNAGMSFMNTKSKGGSNMEAIVNALVSSSAMGNSQYRSQSGSLVANALIQAISGMSNKR
jgi:hypothetical protein